MKVLVTGHRGYIGCHLVALLRNSGHRVTGCDLGLYEGCEWSDFVHPHHELVKDIRKIEIADLKDIDCIMHLAAISNDPMGALNTTLTQDINLHGSVHLAQLAKYAGVTRFLFASSCSVYGKSGNDAITESGSLAPISAYAESKIKAERAIAVLADTNFSPTFLRSATAFGASPMLRLDLVANNLLACAIALGEIRIQSDGTPWRPLIHAKDIARAFITCSQAPRNMVHNQAINIGSNSANYQVKDIADAVKSLVPSTAIIYTGEIGNDPRDYRVNFDFFKKLFPTFQMEYDLLHGLKMLLEQFRQFGLNRTQFEGDQFFRLRTLKKQLYKLETTAIVA